MEATEKLAVPVQENMWVVRDGKTHLAGSKCEDCGELFFPRKSVPLCANCHSRNLREVEYSETGTVVVFTEVIMRPAGGFYKGPIPFTYAIVRLDDGIKVQGHVTGVKPEDLKVGDRVKTVVDVLWDNEEETVLSYKFTPVI